MNYEFHLEEWLPRFPLREYLPGCGYYSADDITSPRDLCNNEWLRRGMIDQFDWGEPVPVDIFVMSKGEPENRFATKIGGLPYRPVEQPWPRSMTGDQLTFIAQFNFMNSKDIVGELPGDLLLVFGEESHGPNESFRFEWQSLGIHDLAQAANIPRNCFKIDPCFGNRSRLLSYPNATMHGDYDELTCDGKEVRSAYWLPQFQATQIGRAPFLGQIGEPSSPVTHLCTIASVQPHPYSPYPWVNVKEPLQPEDDWKPLDTNELMIGDLGCIHIYFEDSDGELYTVLSCF